MKPYRIEIKMVSPIVVGKFPLHLDSLFYWLLFDFLDSEEEVLKTLDSVIEKSADGTYLCSALYFDKKPTFIKTGITSKSDHMIDQLYDLNAWSDQKINGEIKLAAVHAIHAKKAFFNATCDKDKTYALLKRVHGIGRLTNSGFGQIESISFEQLDTDESLLSSGKLMRVISDEEYTDEMLEQVGAVRGFGRFTLPYHTCRKTNILIPARLTYMPLKTTEHKKGNTKGFKK
jgi:hypothetical protein